MYRKQRFITNKMHEVLLNGQTWTRYAILLIIAILLVQCSQREGSKIILYPAPGGDGSLPLSSDFKVFANEHQIDVYSVKVLKPHTWAGDWGKQEYEYASMAYFDFEGTAKIRIVASEIVNSLKIRPSRYNIKSNFEDSTIEFTLDKPCNLSIEINENITNNLQLFTNSIAADTTNPDDPGVRYFGPGVHFPSDMGIPGAIKVQSNETIYIAGGAIVHGIIQTPYHDSVSNVNILGRGILLGERDTEQKRGLLKMGFHANDITIKDIHLVDSYGWVLSVYWCHNVLIDNVKIISYRPNSDGIDIASSSEVNVKNCYIRSADDNLVVINVQYDTSLVDFYEYQEGYYDHYGKLFMDIEHQAQKRNTKNVKFSNCTLWQDRDNPDAIHVGWSMRGPEIRNVYFEEIDIIHTRGGEKTAQLDIDPSWWGDENTHIRNISFKNIYLEDAHGGNIIHVRADPGTIDSVFFENIFLQGGNFSQSTMLKKDKYGFASINNIFIDNYQAFNQPLTTIKKAKIQLIDVDSSAVSIK